MEKIKALFTVAVSALFSLLGVLAVPVLLLVGCNVIDYITGLIAASYRGNKINSYTSIRGIFKKIGMWLLVIIGSWMDVLVSYILEQTGIDLGWNFLIAVVVSVWLVANEMISILENLIDIGVKLPPFVIPIAQKIRTSVEASADMSEVSKNEKGD